MWQKQRALSPGEKEFHLTGLRENPEAMEALERPMVMAAAPDWNVAPEWNPKWL